MFRRRGGLAMATHGRHILVENGRARARKLAAAKLAAGCLLLALVSGCASFPMDASERPGLAPICYQWTASGSTKLLAGCRPELTGTAIPSVSTR